MKCEGYKRSLLASRIWTWHLEIPATAYSDFFFFFNKASYHRMHGILQSIWVRIVNRTSWQNALEKTPGKFIEEGAGVPLKNIHQSAIISKAVKGVHCSV